MGVTEPQRLALHAAARAALGDEEGDTLMALSPPSNTDVATVQGLERTEERLDARITATGERLDARITATGERLDARITATGERLDARITATEERLDARITATVAASEARLTRNMHAAELRTIGVIVLAFLGTNFLG